MDQEISVDFVVPVFNEAEIIESCLKHLDTLNLRNIIFVDGGSVDGTLEILERHASSSIQVLKSSRSQRAFQMNLGWKASSAGAVCFVHADTRMPGNAVLSIQETLKKADYGGFFKQYFPSNGLLKVYAWFLNHFYFKGFENFVGSNAVFFRREFIASLEGFPEVDFMEDVLFSKTCKSKGRFAPVSGSPVSVSSRRYYRGGVMRHIFRNAKIMFKYGVLRMRPHKLKGEYHA